MRATPEDDVEVSQTTDSQKITFPHKREAKLTIASYVYFIVVVTNPLTKSIQFRVCSILREHHTIIRGGNLSQKSARPSLNSSAEKSNWFLTRVAT